MVDNFGAETLEAVRSVDNGDVGVEVFVRVLVVVVLARDAHANALRDLCRCARVRQSLGSAGARASFHPSRACEHRSSAFSRETYVTNTLAPHRLVKLDVDAHIRRLHRLLRELLNLRVVEDVSRLVQRSRRVPRVATFHAGNFARDGRKTLFATVFPSRAPSRAQSSPPHVRAPSPRLGLRSRSFAFARTHRRDRSRRALLEGHARDGLAQVNGVVAGDNVRGLRFASHGSSCASQRDGRGSRALGPRRGRRAGARGKGLGGES